MEIALINYVTRVIQIQKPHIAIATTHKGVKKNYCLPIDRDLIGLTTWAIIYPNVGYINKFIL